MWADGEMFVGESVGATDLEAALWLREVGDV